MATAGRVPCRRSRRVCAGLDELEREERALENMVQALVNRPAAVPIGVKFHREGAGAMLQQPVATGADSSRAGEVAVDPDMRFMQANSSEEEEVEDEDEEDLDEDEMMMDEDDEEEETTGRATIVRGEGPPQRYDSFEREESDEEPMDVEPQFDEELPPPSDWQ